MALDVQKSVTLNGTCVIEMEENGTTVRKQVEAYTAKIDSADPNNIIFGGHPINKDLLKEYRAQRRKDEAEFEDMAYAIQDEMLAALSAE